MGCNKRLIEHVLDLSDELHELVCMDIDIPTMPVDKVRVNDYYYFYVTPVTSQKIVLFSIEHLWMHNSVVVFFLIFFYIAKKNAVSVTSVFVCLLLLYLSNLIFSSLTLPKFL